MKNAKIALVAALVMTVLNIGRCVVMLFFGVISLSNETNRAFPKTGEMQATASVQEHLQAALQQAQAAVREQSVHHDQIALYGEFVGLAWNLLLAGLLIFAISRFQKSN